MSVRKLVKIPGVLPADTHAREKMLRSGRRRHRCHEPEPPYDVGLHPPPMLPPSPPRIEPLRMFPRMMPPSTAPMLDPLVLP